jgi:hypothetical protein
MIAVSHDFVSNAFRFLAALALLPGVFSVGRRIRIKGARKPFLVAILALVLSFGLVSVDQQFSQYVPWLRWVRHLMVAVAGFGFAWAAWKVRKHELAVPAVHR